MTARKAPQDHKRTNEEIFEDLQQDFSEIEGSELIVPLGKIRATDQMRIMGRIQRLGLMDAGEDGKTDLDLDGFADLVDWIGEKFSVNQAKFEDWSSGAGGMSRTMKLCMALMSELGKGLSSDDS